MPGPYSAFDAMRAAMKVTHMASCKVQIPDGYDDWRMCGKAATPDATVLDWPVCAECLAAIR